jgi:4-amino-4-deoxy-L-arabinose transferase-like glycosyltransferase
MTRGDDSMPRAPSRLGLAAPVPILALAAIVALVAAVSWGLGAYPLLDPDEGRNAEVAREMMAGGDFVLPRLDGLPYLDKPVLFFAADALSQRLLGAGEAAARLPALVFALATAALTAWFAGRLFGRRARWIAGIAALAAPLPIAFARTVIFDSALTFFMVVALCAFYLAIEAARREAEAADLLPAAVWARPEQSSNGPGETLAQTAAGRRSAASAGLLQKNVPGGWLGWPRQSSNRSGETLAHTEAGRRSAASARPLESNAPGGELGWTALAWVAMGLGVLTKGPVALAVPLLAAAPFAALRRSSRAVWHPLGPALLALCVGPWLWAVSRRVPEFLHYALFTETWQRVTTPEMNREGPIWFFIPCLLAGALPWSVLALAGCRHGWAPRGGGGRLLERLDPARLYLALWIGLPLVLFSLSHSKRPQYILPLMPAVAIMAAKVWVDATAAAEAEAAPSPASGEPAAAAEPAVAAGELAVVVTAPSPPAFAGTVPGARAAGWTWLALALLCAAGPAVLPRIHSIQPRLAHVSLLPPTLTGLAVAYSLGAALVFLGVRQGRRRQSPSGTAAAALLLAGLVLPMAALPAVLQPLLAEIGSHRSSRAAAAAIAPHLAPGAEVVAVHAYPPSLPFYLRRTVLVATPRGRELTSNYVIAYFQKWIAADPRDTPLRPTDWWRGALAACDHPLVFVTWADDAADRAALAAAGLPLLVANDRMAAYGPCTGHPARPGHAAEPAEPGHVP